MKCKAIIIRNSGKPGFCSEEAGRGKCFCDKHRGWAISFLIFPVFLFVLGYFGTKLLDIIFVSDNTPIATTLHIEDWQGRIDNQEIYEKGGVIVIDGQKDYSEELTKTNRGKFKFELPFSYNKRQVRVHLETEDKYKFMKLDTVIFINRDSSVYRLKMRFEGIDGISNCTLINSVTLQPIAGAVVKIKGNEVRTGNNGKFTIKLPLPDQEWIQTLIIKKDGYRDYVDTKFDMTVKSSTIGCHLEKK